MKDLMIDLETADNVVGAALFSCAVVQCNLTTGETGKEFHRVVHLQSCIDNDLTVNGDTIYWWLKQSVKARKSIDLDNKLELGVFCSMLNMFIKDCAKELKISPKHFKLWGNGASFDNSIIRYAYRMVNQELVVPFWNDRDVRTVVGFYPNNLFQELKQDIPRTESHNALHDALYQIKYVSYIMKELGVETLY